MKLGRLCRSALWGALVLAGQAAASAVEPRVFLDADDRLVISEMPLLLTEADVERHLDSGLTTSFVLQVRPQGPAKPGAARVDVRLELWDEVYLLAVVDGEGRLERFEHPSKEALVEWWTQAEIVLSMPVTKASGNPSVGSKAKVSLAVVPFSQAELRDTQRWLTESIGQTQGGSGAGREGGASRAVGALIATSIQRRAVRSMSWDLLIERRDEP